MREYYGDRAEVKNPLPREDVSGISIAKAQKMLGYYPKRYWRNYLNEEGKLKPGTSEGLFNASLLLPAFQVALRGGG